MADSSFDFLQQAGFTPSTSGVYQGSPVSSDVSNPQVLPPPSQPTPAPPAPGAPGDQTGGSTRIPNPRFPPLPNFSFDQPLGAGTAPNGFMGAQQPGGPTTQPTAGNGQITLTEQQLQQMFTGNNNVLPILSQMIGSNFDPQKLLQIRGFLESLGIKLQIKPSDNGLPSGRITLKDGTMVDLNNNGRWGWIVRGPAGPETGSGTGNGSGSGSGFNPFSGSPLGNLTQRSNDLWNLLWGRANQSLNINRNDPIIRNLSDAYAAMQQRGSRQYLQNQAEKLGSYTNMTAEERFAAQNIAQNTSAFEANLMKDELAARRQEIAQSLQLMEGQLTSEEDMSLRLYLGQLDAQIRMLSLSEQMREFNNSLSQRAFEFDVNDEFRRSPLA